MTGSHSPDSNRSPFDTVIRIVVAAVSLLVPFVFYPGLADPFQLPKQILFEMGALLILGIWLGRILTSGRVAILRSGVAAPMLLLVFIAFLSTFQAPNVAEALSRAQDISLAALLLFLIPQSLDAKNCLPAASLGTAAVLTSLLGLLQILAGPRLGLLPPTAGGGLTGDVSSAAMFVSFLLPLVLGQAFSSEGICRWGWAVGAGIAGGYLMLARTRPAWLGAVTGLVLLAVVRLIWRPGSERASSEEKRSNPLKVVGASTAVGLTLFLSGVYWTGIHPMSLPPSLKIVELQGFTLRLESWRATLDLILTHPLGVGAGNWRAAFSSQVGSLTPATPFAPSRLPSQAGNEYLETAAELGPVGLVLLVWFLWRLLAAARRSAVRREGMIASAVFAGIGALAAGGLLSSSLTEQPTLWAAMVLASLILTPLSDPTPSGLEGREEWWIWEFPHHRRRLIASVVSLGFLPLAAVLAWNCCRVLKASASLARGQTAYSRMEYAAALHEFLEAGRLNPSSYNTRYLTGTCAQHLGRLDLAETELREALRLSPQDAGSLLALGSTLKARGKFIDAVAAYEKARKTWPQDPRVLLSLGEMREAAGDLKGAIEVYGMATSRNPYSAQAYLRLGSALDKNDQLNSAVGAYLKAVELDPYLPEGLYQLGSAYLKQGYFEGSVRTLNNLLAITPDDFRTLLQLARAEVGLERFCEAQGLLERARETTQDPGRRSLAEKALESVSPRCRPAAPARR